MNQLNNYPGKVLAVRIYGDPILRQKSESVEQVDEDIKKFVADMIVTMYEKDGVGLAAPQVGKNLRIFVIDPEWSRTNQKNPQIFINPRIISMSGVEVDDEGCLSLPEIFAEVKRAEKIVLEAMDLNGELKRYEAEGFYARTIQHEFDHIDGVLFIDRISKLKLLSLKWKLKALEQTKDENGVNLDKYFIDKQNSVHRNS
ncbi:MAG: peptide deformylase [Candidatus Cloacimonetes bacterium]|nr:peptide deformylase [Candidatus Cloacimonadota bacterium]